MNTAVYWPYDEVVLKTGESPSEFLIEAPWLGTSATLADSSVSRARELAKKFKKSSIGPSDLEDLNWFFAPLAKFPLCYQLPRRSWAENLERFVIDDSSLLELSPSDFLVRAVRNPDHAADAAKVAGTPLFQGPWKWDVDGAVQFSFSTSGIDPQALFSVARRFHLLSAVESNTTAQLYERVKNLKDDPQAFAWASALMVRQNHYVTERCNGALAPALNRAGRAQDKVREFMRAEYGHDRILRSALLTLTDDPMKIPVTSQSKVLMDLLQFSAERNFLAFALAVDFFERSPYQESDPLAQVLSEGNLDRAAKQINRHHAINDEGEHENVALGFLETMGPIDKDYATEALRIAEVLTNVMNTVAAGVEERF